MIFSCSTYSGSHFHILIFSTPESPVLTHSPQSPSYLPTIRHQYLRSTFLPSLVIPPPLSESPSLVLPRRSTPGRVDEPFFSPSPANLLTLHHQCPVPPAPTFYHSFSAIFPPSFYPGPSPFLPDPLSLPVLSTLQKASIVELWQQLHISAALPRSTFSSSTRRTGPWSTRNLWRIKP